MNTDAEQAIHAANSCRNQDDPAGALRVLRRAAKRSPKSAEVLYALGLELDRQDQHKQAAQTWRRALELAPQSVEIINELGNAEQAAGRLEAALERYLQAAELAPDSAAVQMNIGDMLRRLGRAADATVHLQRALQLDPGALAAHYHLAIIALERGDANAGLVHLEQYAALPRNLPDGLALKAVALKALGRDDEANRLLDFDRFLWIRHLSAPDGYASMRKFNRDLEHFILKQRLTPDPFSASTRGGRHGDDLLGKPQGPAVALNNMLRAAFTEYIQALPEDPGHPFLAAGRPRVRIVAQANILDSAGYLRDHVHPQAWVSGAYYVRVPDEIEDSPGNDEHAGWLRFGALPDTIQVPPAGPIRHVKPAEGMLVMFPAYFYHGTVPFRSKKHRMSLGIDIITI